MLALVVVRRGEHSVCLASIEDKGTEAKKDTVHGKRACVHVRASCVSQSRALRLSAPPFTRSKLQPS